MVLEDDMLLPAKEMYVGQEADEFRTKNTNHAFSTLQHNIIYLDFFSLIV